MNILLKATAILAIVIFADKCSYSGGRAEAHPWGPVCQYQTYDAAGSPIVASAYCHHLNQGIEAQPYYGRPGMFWRFGGGGWGHRWGPHNWMTARPGIGLHFGGPGASIGINIPLGGGGGGGRPHGTGGGGGGGQ